MWSSIEPPTSRNSSTLTALWRSGTILRSSQPALRAVRVDRAVEVEFVGGALARETAQAAQRHLDVARAELDAVVEVAELALVPDLDRAAVAGRFAGRCGCPPGCSRMRRRASVPRGADPFVAALVPLLLLARGAALSVSISLLAAAELLDLGASSSGLRCASRHASQPLLGDRSPRRAGAALLDALEVLGEHPVEAVVVALVLDQQVRAST